MASEGKFKLTRRRFVQSTGAGVAALAAPRVVSASSGRVIYSGYGGSYQESFTKAVIEPFQQKTGIEVVVTTGAPDVAVVKAQVESGYVEWDVLELYTGNYQQLAKNQVLDELDRGVVDVTNIFEPSIVTPYFAPSYLYSINPFWNTKMAKGAVSSWSDLWNTSKVTGKRGISDDPSITLESALLADGVAPKDLYPLNVDRALASLQKLVDSGAVVKGMNELTNLLSIGEISTSVGGPALNRIQRAIKDGLPLQYSWEQHIVDPAGLGVLKNAPNRDNAMKFVAFQLQPEAQLGLYRELGYTPTVNAARSQIPASKGADLAASEQTAPEAVFLSGTWYAEAGDSASKAYQKWILSLS